MACIKDPLKKELMKVATTFEKDAKVKAFGYGDPSTGEWLWNKYVGQPRDPKRPVSSTDLKKFEVGLKEFKDTIGKKENEFLKWFKLPKALMRKLPESSHFVEEMSNATSFRQRHLKEASVELDQMFTGLFDMILKGDYYGGASWSKKEHKRYQNLERNLEAAKTPQERMDAMKDITEVVGVKDGNNNPIGGQLLRRYNDLLFKCSLFPLILLSTGLLDNLYTALPKSSFTSIVLEFLPTSSHKCLTLSPISSGLGISFILLSSPTVSLYNSIGSRKYEPVR